MKDDREVNRARSYTHFVSVLVSDPLPLPPPHAGEGHWGNHCGLRVCLSAASGSASISASGSGSPPFVGEGLGERVAVAMRQYPKRILY
jgi:hypothetical protein